MTKKQRPSARSPIGERGYAMVALLAGIAIMTIFMSMGVSSWKYVMKDDREEELIFRGNQIAGAIKLWQAKNGNTFPPSLDVMVKGKFLRKAFKDPMEQDGKWRFLRPGEGAAIPRPGASPAPGASPSPLAQTALDSKSSVSASGSDRTIGGQIGVIAGVASRSTDTSLRIVNGRTHYNEWLFIAGQPIVVGQPTTIGGGGLIKPTKK